MFCSMVSPWLSEGAVLHPRAVLHGSCSTLYPHEKHLCYAANNES